MERHARFVAQLCSCHFTRANGYNWLKAMDRFVGPAMNIHTVCWVRQPILTAYLTLLVSCHRAERLQLAEGDGSLCGPGKEHSNGGEETRSRDGACVSYLERTCTWELQGSFLQNIRPKKSKVLILMFPFPRSRNLLCELVVLFRECPNSYLYSYLHVFSPMAERVRMSLKSHKQKCYFINKLWIIRYRKL